MNSKILLVKNINMDKEYVNVLSYSESQMLTLCEQNLVAQSNKYSFIRQNENEIYVNFSYQQCLQANYIAFQNTDYGGKWFFAWIDDIIYENDGTTRIKYIIDSWSTWFDYWTKKPCFIVREHVNNDTIGLHTIPENLDVGEVVEEKEQEDISLNEFGYVAIISSWNPSTEKQFSAITVYNKQVFGKPVYLIPSNQLSDLQNLGLFIIKTNADGHIDDIDSIFWVPDALINASDLIENTASIGEQTFNFYSMKNKFSIASFIQTVTKQHDFSDYTPKNNKCYVYPYNYLLVSNNIGNTNIFKYEDFYSDTCNFKTELAMSIGVSGQLIPLSYKKQARADDEGLSLAKYPTCSWSSDSFTNWLTQNAVNEANNMAFGLFNFNPKQEKQSQSSIISTNINTGLSIASNIANQIGNFYSGSLMPNMTKRK